MSPSIITKIFLHQRKCFQQPCSSKRICPSLHPCTQQVKVVLIISAFMSLVINPFSQQTINKLGSLWNCLSPVCRLAYLKKGDLQVPFFYGNPPFITHATSAELLKQVLQLYTVPECNLKYFLGTGNNHKPAVN